MIVCQHTFEQLTLLDIAHCLANHPSSNDLIDTGKKVSLNFSCRTCGAQVETTFVTDILKPGKSRKTNRLWALLKGVA